MNRNEISAFLKLCYPIKGKNWCAEVLGVSESLVRIRAAQLGLRVSRNSEFYKEWQTRAALSKVGRKRPDHSKMMRQLYQEGRILSKTQTSEQISERVREWHQQHDHPRGYAGHTHTVSAKAKMSEASKAAWANPESRLNNPELRQLQSDRMAEMQASGKLANEYSRCKRVRIGKYLFRSLWEANYSRYLEWMRLRGEIFSWEYESETFWFLKIKRGVRSYKPDFKVWDTADSSPRYVEVKGWMDAKSQTKIRRMAKYYPQIRLEVFGKNEYNQLCRSLGRAIPGWDSI